MRAASLLLLALVLSGCSGRGPDRDGDRDAGLELGPGGPLALAFEPARAVATVSNIEHEAFVAVSPDGQVVLSCSHGEFKEPANLFASTDGGATFRELDPTQGGGNPLLPAGDCEVALAPDGTWAFAGKTDLGIAVMSTSDQGATWRVNHLAGPPFNGLADRPWMAYAGGTLLMTYQPGTQQAGPVLFSRSQDHGATWTDPVEIAGTEPLRAGIAAGDFAVASDSMAVHFVVQHELPGGPTGVRFELLSSIDAGATWTRQDMPVSSLDAYPSVPALGPAGVLTWAYQDLDDLEAITSHDGGATWGGPVALGTGIAWPRLWAAARPDGLVDVAWMAAATEAGRAEGLAVTRLDPAAGAVLGETIVAGIGFLEYAGLAHDASGRAHAVAMDAPRKSDATTDLDGDLLYIRERPQGTGR